jgi:release factor glutamine methyltransferase
MTSLHERIAEARDALVRAGLAPADAAIDAEVLARHALDWDRARLLARGREPSPPGFDEQFRALIARRAAREPVAMITGHREFWGLEFAVSPDVLIPRPESELIVEAVCEFGVSRTIRRIVDVGTGSGCLAVALAHEFPAARILATDISPAALRVAAANVARHHVSRQVSCVCSHLLDAVAGPVDVIVSNPPYVPDGVRLSPDIVRYEPAVALYSGVDGLFVLERLIAAVKSCLAERGVFVVEFGFGQEDAVLSLAAAAGWSRVTIKHDLQEIPRVAVMET